MSIFSFCLVKGIITPRIARFLQGGGFCRQDDEQLRSKNGCTITPRSWHIKDAAEIIRKTHNTHTKCEMQGGFVSTLVQKRERNEVQVYSPPPHRGRSVSHHLFVKFRMLIALNYVARSLQHQGEHLLPHLPCKYCRAGLGQKETL